MSRLLRTRSAARADARGAARAHPSPARRARRAAASSPCPTRTRRARPATKPTATGSTAAQRRSPPGTSGCRRLVELARAIEIAELEIDGRYHPERHDALFDVLRRERSRARRAEPLPRLPGLPRRRSARRGGADAADGDPRRRAADQGAVPRRRPPRRARRRGGGDQPRAAQPADRAHGDGPERGVRAAVGRVATCPSSGERIARRRCASPGRRCSASIRARTAAPPACRPT